MAQSDKNDKSQIREINQDTVKFIAAGQKISDIETAVRELIENSIDARAKFIEVRLVRFGVDCIEVEDNGVGIEEDDFHALGIRYHTSKINSYSKLTESLETFGFRGEALSCLCKIAHVSILTKSQNSPTGTKLVFSENGTISNREQIARTVGTTVIVKNLFYSLPVRRRELETTAKRQYDKVVKLIYEQVIARPHVKFSLYKKTANKKVLDFTYGNGSLESVIISVFGVKTLEALMPIKQTGLQGLVDLNKQSKSSEDKCESTNTNSTPANLDEDSKRAGDGNPISDIKIETTVAPNRGFFKRLRRSKFKSERVEYTIYGYISRLSSGRSSADCQFIYVNNKPCDVPRVTRVINELYRTYSRNQYPFLILFIEVQNWAADFNVPRKREVILQDENRLIILIKESIEEMFSPSMPKIKKSCASAQIPMASSPIAPATPRSVKPKSELLDNLPPSEVNMVDSTIELAVENQIESLPTPRLSSKSKEDCPKIVMASELVDHTVNIPSNSPALVSRSPSLVSFQNIQEGTQLQSELIISPIPNPTPFTTSSSHLKESSSSTMNVNSMSMDEIRECRFIQTYKLNQKKYQISIDHLEDLGFALQRERDQRQFDLDYKEFSFAIHPRFNAVAEEELKINLNKKSFESMQVIGQFNKGFIITKLNKHLFIIDQHATDERANYEAQLDKSPMTIQQMVWPKPLYLNSIQENVVMNNLNEFRKKGFEFRIDETKVAGFRVLLTATSVCKGQGLDIHLGREDVVELIDVITNCPNNLPTYTLEKVKYVAASRACRKSVMIGESLSWTQMSDIVYKMSTLKNPWICAHNRPTIRHLMDVDVK